MPLDHFPSSFGDEPDRIGPSECQQHLMNAPIGVFGTTPEGRYIFANPAQAKLLGYETPRELLDAITDIATQVYAVPADRDEFMRALEAHDELVNHECRLRHRDGSIIWGAMTVRAVRDSAGNVSYYHGFTSDITARKRAEEELQRSEQKYRELVENINDVVYTVDLEGRIGYLSPSALNIFSDAETLVGRQFLELVDPRDISVARKAWDDVMHNRLKANEYRLCLQPGQTIWVRTSSRPAYRNGTLVGVVGVLADITERKEAEEYLQQVLDATNDGIWDYDLVSRKFRHSDRWAQMLGFDSGKAEDFSFYCHKNIHPEDSGRFQQAFKDCVEGTASNYGVEFRLRKKDGEYIWIYSRGRALQRDASGRALRMVGAHTDISERKLAEDALRESEERFRLLVESAPVSVLLIQKGRYVYGNQASHALLGYDNPQDMIGRYALDTIAPEYRDQVAVRMKRIELGGDNGPMEMQILRQDGRRVWCLSTSVRVLLNNEATAIVVGQDISVRKQTERELNASMAELSAIHKSAPVVMMLFDQQVRLTKANQAASAFVNQGKNNMRGLKCGEALCCVSHPVAPQGCGTGRECTTCVLRKTICDTFADQKSRQGIEYWLRFHDGDELQERCLLVSADYLKALEEPQVLICALDITPQKIVEKRLIRAKEEADAANQSKSEFLANMSHELRTPLNGIMGLMQVLQITRLDEEQQDFVSMAIKSSERLARLLTDLLDISKIEAGKMEIFDEEFSLQELADSVSELFTLNAQERNVALRCSLDPALPPKLVGGVARLRQILFNLVGNAMKFTEHGSVSVEMVPLSSPAGCETRVLFSVIDTGIGIPESKFEELFKPFVQIEGSYTRKYQGVGLGLAIVRRLVELMHGHIHIESVLGEGTSVHVVLPFRLPQCAVSATMRSASGQDAPSRGLRILLAEDDSSNQLPIQRMLEMAGHSVILAENGRQALDLLQAGDFDCILMDIQMPVMNGLETTQAIRGGTVGKVKSKIPIIAMTAYAMTGDREKFLDAGMDDYLSKPVNMEDLERTLARHCRRGQ